ncbi:Dual specificity protein kinase shkD [Balamuthia mandrillaris]
MLGKKKKDKKSKEEQRAEEETSQRPVLVGAPEIQASELEYKAKIGEGAFAEVFSGKCRGLHVAIKKLKQQRLSEEATETFKKEVELMCGIRHPNVIRFLGACTSEGEVACVIEYMANGCVEDLLKDKGQPLSTVRKLSLIRDIALGMNWLHRSIPPIIHRDLKPSNLLLDANERVIICDFGLSITSPFGVSIRDEKVIRGTPLYMPPEVMQGQDITTKSDVYSFGLVIWQIMTRKLPFKDLVQKGSFKIFSQAVIEGQRPSLKKFPEDCPPSLEALVQACWATDPHDRPSFDVILDALEEIIIEASISDVHGRAFWKEHFLGQEEVAWKTFSKAIRNTQIFGVEDSSSKSRELLCLMAVLAKDGTGPVTMKRFGDFCAWFGPLQSSKKNLPVSKKVSDLLQRAYFHGDMSSTEAETRLDGGEPGTFLIRFSSTERGGYTISHVTKENVLQHQRIYFQPEEGFQVRLRSKAEGGRMTVYASKRTHLPDFVSKLKDHLFLMHPCGGSKYKSIFTMQTDVKGYDLDGGRKT